MFHLENEIWSVERASIISIIQDGIAARERIRLQRLPQRDILHLLDEFGHRAAICIAFAQYAQCAPHDIPVRGQRRNEASINARWVDFPAPVGPIIKVCPTSSACRLKRNGVWPLVFASSNGGLLGG